MKIELTPREARVIGCLIEKEVTTPEQYPLSLNALTNACNQKSNRDPVMSLEESDVQDLLDGLAKKYLVSEKTGFGSRVPKHKHRFCNTEFGSLKFSEQELGVLCVMFLRGPQTPGELRTRTNRLCKFADVHEVETTLEGLMGREDGPFVARLPREPGKRESRYAHLFSGAVQAPLESPGPESAAIDSPAMDRPIDSQHAGVEHGRLDELERQVGELRRELEEVKRTLVRLVRGASSRD